MLEVILNRCKPHAEEVIAEEQTEFRTGRSNTQQIFYPGILCEKYLKHKQNLYHILVDLKKPLTEYAMQPYWPPCGGAVSFANLVCTIEQLYDKSTTAFQMNGTMEELIKTTVNLYSVTLQHFSRTDRVCCSGRTT